MDIFPRHHRIRLVRCRNDDTLTTPLALNVVLHGRHHGAWSHTGGPRAMGVPEPASPNRGPGVSDRRDRDTVVNAKVESAVRTE